MADIVSPQKRSEMMSGIRGKDTKPEIIARKALHKRGFRFRLHNRKLPGKPDIVLPKYQTVMLINGCFWHGHNCHLFKWPKSNKEFWEDKINGTKARDIKNKESLEKAGWHVITIWECQLRGHSTDSVNSTFDDLSDEIRRNIKS